MSKVNPDKFDRMMNSLEPEEEEMEMEEEMPDTEMMSEGFIKRKETV